MKNGRNKRTTGEEEVEVSRRLRKRAVVEREGERKKRVKNMKK